MMEIILEREAPREYFPTPVLRLVSFIVANKALFPVFANYLCDTKVSDDQALRADTFVTLWQVYFPDQTSSVSLATSLKELLGEVYQLDARSSDPRGIVVEYLLFVLGPIDIPRDCDQREIQCSLRIKAPRRPRLVESSATFDVGYLTSGAFEGHECKAQIRNFLPGPDVSPDIPREAQSKLRYMADVKVAVEAQGMTVSLYLSGIDPDGGVTKRILQEKGFKDINVLASPELEEALNTMAAI